ncbi:MAG: hypothetical protein WC728_05890 [Elusimicrobiota bacterium]
MEFIAHRVNTVQALRRVPPEYGVEVDLRDHGKRLVLQHEPFVDGEDFAPFVRRYRHGTMILNVKSERIEPRVLETIRGSRVRRYFFLDSSFPMIFQLIRAGERNIALRFSEFEGLETILNLRGKARWVWVDCFTRWPLTRAAYQKLKRAGFKLCVVSPDLVGRPGGIEPMRRRISRDRVVPDAVCCKLENIPRWRI